MSKPGLEGPPPDPDSPLALWEAALHRYMVLPCHGNVHTNNTTTHASYEEALAAARAKVANHDGSHFVVRIVALARADETPVIVLEAKR